MTLIKDINTGLYVMYISYDEHYPFQPNHARSVCFTSKPKFATHVDEPKLIIDTLNKIPLSAYKRGATCIKEMPKFEIVD